MPRVSVGVPVYNGQRYLATALDSLLAQTFQDLEIVICDNASTDGTPEICARYADRDPRVRYHRNASNLGAAPNFNRTFELSRGTYFKWAAHDDVCAPTFVEECCRVLDADDSVALCFTGVRVIDAAGQVMGDHPVDLRSTELSRPHLRIPHLMGMTHWCFDVFGLIRRSALERTSLIRSHIGSDRNLLVELALLGRLVRVPRPLFYSREHPERSIRAFEVPDQAPWYDTSHAARWVFPHWRILLEYARSIRRAPLGAGERLRCYRHLAGWVHWHPAVLLRDVRHAARAGARRRNVAANRAAVDARHCPTGSAPE